MDIQAALYTVRFILAPMAVWLFFIFGLCNCSQETSLQETSLQEKLHQNKPLQETSLQETSLQRKSLQEKLHQNKPLQRKSLLVFFGFCIYLTLASYLLIVTMGFYPFSRISVFISFVPTVILIPLVISRESLPRTLFMLFTVQNVVLFLTIFANLVRSLLDLGLLATIVLIAVLSVAALVFAIRKLAEPLHFVATHIQGHWSAMNATPLLICALTIGLSVYGNVRFHDEPFLATGISLAFEFVYLFFIYTLYHNLRDISELSERLRDDDLVHMQVAAMQQQLQLLDEREREGRIAAHDRRHFDNMLAGLLRQGEVGLALEVLGAHTDGSQPRRFCANATVNAVVASYARKAEDKGIRFETHLDIPEKLDFDQTGLAIVISNLLENAFNACEAIHEDAEHCKDECIIRFLARNEARLLMVIENPVRGTVDFDEDGNPISMVAGHGIGTRSVRAFAERSGALVEYRVQDGVFVVRLIV